jgi:hypothetical protein
MKFEGKREVERGAHFRIPFPASQFPSHFNFKLPTSHFPTSDFKRQTSDFHQARWWRVRRMSAGPIPMKDHVWLTSQ